MTEGSAPMPTSALEQLARAAAERGMLVEAGWLSLRIAAYPVETPPEQLTELRAAFFAGAHHLFSSIIAMFDQGAEPTEADYAKMDMVDAELKAFIGDFVVKMLPVKGSA